MSRAKNATPQINLNPSADVTKMSKQSQKKMEWQVEFMETFYKEGKQADTKVEKK